MVYETDISLSPDLRKWGCALISLAHYNPDLDAKYINSVADRAKAIGVLDAEDTILDWQKMVNILGFPLKYRGEHSPPDCQFDPHTVYALGEWHNDATGFTHFVVMDGWGTGKDNVEFDPIEGGSRTVREGAFVSYRLFDHI